MKSSCGQLFHFIQNKCDINISLIIFCEIQCSLLASRTSCRLYTVVSLISIQNFIFSKNGFVFSFLLAKILINGIHVHYFISLFKRFLIYHSYYQKIFIRQMVFIVSWGGAGSHKLHVYDIVSALCRLLQSCSCSLLLHLSRSKN